MRKLIYKEDDQMYWFTPILFETNAEITSREMELISYEKVGAGRFSTEFEEFKKLMENYGYTIKEVERFPRNSIPIDNIFEIVTGATGNY